MSFVILSQRRRLATLLKLQNGDIDIDTAIRDLEVEMREEDIAWVKSKILTNDESKN